MSGQDRNNDGRGFLDIFRSATKALDTLRDGIETITKLNQAIVRFKEENWSWYADMLIARFRKSRTEPVFDHLTSKQKIELIDGSASESDEIVRELWLNLMHKSFDPNERFKPRRIYTNILRSLEGIDAAVLIRLYHLGRAEEIDIGDLSNKLGFDKSEIRVSLSNLERQCCLMYVDDLSQHLVTEASVSRERLARVIIVREPRYNGTVHYEMTDLCYKLMHACGRDTMANYRSTSSSTEQQTGEE